MIKKGTKVKWNWGNGAAEGKVEAAYTTKIAKMIKGNEVIRNGEKGNKALYILQDDGDYVLKSENEVERADQTFVKGSYSFIFSYTAFSGPVK